MGYKYAGLLVGVALTVIFALPFLTGAADIYETRLDAGLKSTEPYSYVLMEKAQADPANAKNLLKEAIKYSPNFPPAYFELSKVSFSFSSEGLFESIDYAIGGFKAYKRNFWWLLSISGIALLSLAMSLTAVLAIVILIRYFKDTPLLSHEIREEKIKALMVLPLIPLSVLGTLFFIAGALMLLGLYFSRADKAVVYAAIFLLLISPFVLRITNMLLSAPSPELRAVAAVNENRDNKIAIAALKGRDDFPSLFSYGLALKREGLFQEAIAAYKNLLSTASSDPRVYVNLGNCYYGINDIASARDLYKKSIEIKPLASAYYNLSQIYRDALDFAKGEEYFHEAAKIDSEAVSKFAATSSKNPNRFVIDETLPMADMWKYAESSTKEIIRVSPSNAGPTILIAIALIFLFYIADSRLKYRAYRCKRCNIILCGKCAKELLWGQMCAQCYKSLIKLDELDPRERVTKLLEVQQLHAKKRNIIRALSFAPPGIAQIYAGRMLSGSLFLWLFLFPLGLIMLSRFPSAGLSTFSHNWLTVPSLIFIVLLYLISNFSVRRRLAAWL